MRAVRVGAILIVLLASSALARPQRLQVEPGYPIGDGRQIVPAVGRDADGRITPLAAAELELRVNGQTTPVLQVLSALPTSVLVISDQTLVREAIEAAAARRRAGDSLEFWSADPRVEGGRGGGTGGLPAAEEPRHWDRLLAGLEMLATADSGADRRVVLIVGDLQGEDRSEHPVATCIEAARDLAVPVYGALLPGVDRASRRRLERLAEASGGEIVTSATAEAALSAGIARILAAEGLVLAVDGLALPAEVTATVAGGSERSVTRIVRRPRGRWTPGAGLVVAVAVVLVAAAGLGAWWRWRTRAVGYLEVDGRRRPVPASGLSIGRGDDNGLVLAETQVSKHHALVRWHRDQVQLVDLRSTNGTVVNGRVIRSVALTDGDEIVLGDAIALVFRARRSRRRIGDGRRDGFVA